MDENRQLQLVAIISCIACGSVMLTLVLFQSMRNRLFMRIISFISLADFLGNIPYTTVHRPATSSVLCSLEGFTNLYFYPVAWLWTTTLVHFLYGLATEGKVPFSEPVVHIICWGIPLVTTLLVLTTNNYERFDEDDDNEVCTIGGDEDSAFVWRIVLYYGLFISSVASMIWMYRRVQAIQKSGESAVSEGMLTLAMQSLRLYPIAMVVSWIPELITFIIQFVHQNKLAVHTSVIFKLSNGIFMAVIFFSKSQQARSLWVKLLTGRGPEPTRDYSQDSSTCFDIMEDFADNERKVSLLGEASAFFVSKSRQVSTTDHQTNW